jgi:predicted enzyme related to lactoylglutathione lyase
MGDYEDYVMNDASGTPVAGVCHRRGANSKMPARWILYITVADLAAAVEQATKLGAKLLDGPRQAGPHGTFAVLEDPAGATFAVYQHGAA